MAISFFPLELSDSSLFGIRLRGTVGRSDKDRLQELVTKCVAHSKTKLILDISELESLSSGAATELATLQRKMTDRDGEVVFIGANETMRQFLERSFDELPLRIFGTASAAETGYHDGTDPSLMVPQIEKPEPVETSGAQTDAPGVSSATDEEAADQEGGAVCLSPESDDTPDSSLDEILGGFSCDRDGERPPALDIAEEPAIAEDSASCEDPSDRAETEDLSADSPPESPTVEVNHAQKAHQLRRADSPSSEPAEPGLRGAARLRYLSLADGMASIQQAKDIAEVGDHLLNLLHSHDLVTTVTYCHRDGKKFVAQDSQREFACDGILAQALATADRPLSLLDINDEELDESETQFLADVTPDLILPIIRRGELVAVAFLRRDDRDHEYSVSENFAMELLMRILAEPRATEIAPGETQDTSDESVPAKSAPAKTAGDALQLQRARALLAVSDDLNEISDESVFWEKLFSRLEADFEIESLVLLEEKDHHIAPVNQFGIADAQVTRLGLNGASGRKYLQGLEQPVAVENLPGSFKKFRTALDKSGLNWLVPLKKDQDWLGILLLGVSSGSEESPVAADLLNELFRRVAGLLQVVRNRQEEENRNLELIQTLISLMEERHYGPGGLSEELIRLVRKVAREINISPAQERDLLYGTLLRDIGMFPTGDMIVDSFGNMSDEQWQQFRGHPAEGAHRLEELSVSETVKDVVLYHHERYNGEGYPHGMEGADIPLVAHIVAVVENYVAMVTTMPNRPALTKAQALEIIQENFGERYDPEVVDVLVRILAEERKEVSKRAVLTKS